MRASKVGMVACFVLAFVVISALAAPLWAHYIAHTGPYTNHLTDTVKVGGKEENVVSYSGIPIGPTFQGRYFLGADSNGRDVMVRLLYAGRTSLLIAVSATAITLFFGALLGILAGFYRGWVDQVISRVLDVLWAFPVILLGVALGVATAEGGLKLGFATIPSGSLILPAAIIGLVNVVYIARPIRGLVLSLRERAFIEAAVSQGASNVKIMRREVLPNLSTSLLVLAPIIVAQTVAFEAALSFLGAGVQAPTPSWGTMLNDGLDVLISAPHLTFAPGVMLVATVLSLNLIGDIVREALDPRGTLRAADRK